MKKKSILHQDNAHPRMTKATIAQIMRHLPYSPDLQPCNFWLPMSQRKLMWWLLQNKQPSPAIGLQLFWHFRVFTLAHNQKKSVTKKRYVTKKTLPKSVTLFVHQHFYSTNLERVCQRTSHFEFSVTSLMEFWVIFQSFSSRNPLLRCPRG